MTTLLFAAISHHFPDYKLSTFIATAKIKPEMCQKNLEHFSSSSVWFFDPALFVCYCFSGENKQNQT